MIPSAVPGSRGKVVVAGGTGFIGSSLTKRLLSEGYHVVVFTRSPRRESSDPARLRFVTWDPLGERSWAEDLEGAIAVVNLAGESIGAGRWSARRKRLIVDSRLAATSAIVTALGNLQMKPSVLINGSAVGYYGDSGDQEITEDSGKGTGFLADTVDRWEAEARKVQRLNIRLVLIRTGVVLGKGGMALERMVLPFRLFIGGPLGSGRQWFPWIHIDDLTAGILFLLHSETSDGVFNAVGPQQVTMRQFSRSLGQTIRRPSWAPVPAFALRLVLGEMSEMVLGGQKAAPVRLIRAGFQFRHPTVDSALSAILD
jgi:uncharacterized protein (TIGR01777 family)